MQNKLAELLEGKTSVAIGGHVRPDGDCVGACMGLYQYLKENYRDIETEVYLEEIPSHFSFIREQGKSDMRYSRSRHVTCLSVWTAGTLSVWVFPGLCSSVRARHSVWITISATRHLQTKTILCRMQAPPRS